MLKKEIYGIPRDIKSKIVMNVTTVNEKATKDVI